MIRDFNLFVEKHIKRDMTLPTDIVEMAKEFNKAGKDLFVVGGAVRDFLQGKVPHDFDVVTNSMPEETKKILKDWNVSDEQGKNFGVLRVYTKDCPEGYEIAVYRKDISKGRDTKGDDDKVEIGEHITIEDDVKRRDLTINALFYDINKREIVDLVGGVNDLENNIIRAVGEPKMRFEEDRLRILRVLRFAARTGGEISKETKDAIEEDNRLRNISSKDDVSQERILEEFDKTLSYGDADIVRRYIALLNDFDMWEEMFPGVNLKTDISISEKFDKSIIFADILQKENIKKKRKFLTEKLKFDRETINQVEFLLELLSKITYNENVYELAKLKNRFHINDELIRDFGEDKHINPSFIEPFLKYCEAGFVVDGNELMKQGFKGREIEIEKIRRETERYKNDFLK